jgi:hypothetical protein
LHCETASFQLVLHKYLGLPIRATLLKMEVEFHVRAVCDGFSIETTGIVALEYPAL